VAVPEGVLVVGLGMEEAASEDCEDSVEVDKVVGVLELGSDAATTAVLAVLLDAPVAEDAGVAFALGVAMVDVPASAAENEDAASLPSDCMIALKADAEGPSETVMAEKPIVVGSAFGMSTELAGCPQGFRRNYLGAEYEILQFSVL
jgi:hypothetical protein